MQEFFSRFTIATQAHAFAGHSAPRDESFLTKIIVESARGLRASELAMFSRRRKAGSAGQAQKRSPQKPVGQQKKSRDNSEADFRADLHHFLKREANGLRSKLDV